MSTLGRGLVAGAVGTTVLDIATYLDMALTGRPASPAPADTVLALADSAGLALSTDGSRPEAYGALGGLAVGVGIGAAAGVVRAVGIRLPLLAEAAVVGAAAMAATDGPMALSGVADPSTWSTTDWTRDVVPHLAFGTAVSLTLRALDRSRPAEVVTGAAVDPALAGLTPRRRPKVLRRSLALGLAAGARSTLGLPAALAIGPRTALVSAGLVASEVVVDKLPATPSRLEAGPALGRIGSGALGAALLAHGEDGSVGVGLVAGAVGAVVGSVLGAAWREVAADRGWAWQGALAEDAAALALTAYAWRA